jgi:purine-nucleoside phosphorylase
MSTTLDPSTAATHCEAAIRAAFPDVAPVDWLVVCGSGMGKDLVDSLDLEVEHELGLSELGLPAPSVEGHGQSLLWAKLGRSRVCLQTGRIHPYEGHPIQICIGALEALLRIGAGGVMLTAAVGGIVDSLTPGQLVSFRDQMNLFGPTPLRGPKFIDCSQIYHPSLRARVEQAARAAEGEPLAEVVYAHARGPQYETPAEVAALRTLGGDIVGMSTTYEGILAASYGVRACGIGLVTNVAGAIGLSHLEVQELASRAKGRLGEIAGRLLSTPPPAESAP